MNTENRMELQTKEFDAADAFAKALRALNLTPIVDDDYPQVRRRYEHALEQLLVACAANGRWLQGGINKTPKIDAILDEIREEIANAVTKFPTWPTRLIDAGNVVSEEAGELAKACLQVTYEPHKETLLGVRDEAIQTAAMCVRLLLSIEQYDRTPGPQHRQGLQ